MISLAGMQVAPPAQAGLLAQEPVPSITHIAPLTSLSRRHQIKVFGWCAGCTSGPSGSARPGAGEEWSSAAAVRAADQQQAHPGDPGGECGLAPKAI